MDTYTAIAIAEGFEKARDEDQILEAWQHLVDSGNAWTLQGWFGRVAHALIKAGEIKPAQNRSIN